MEINQNGLFCCIEGVRGDSLSRGSHECPESDSQEKLPRKHLPVFILVHTKGHVHSEKRDPWVCGCFPKDGRRFDEKTRECDGPLYEEPKSALKGEQEVGRRTP